MSEIFQDVLNTLDKCSATHIKVYLLISQKSSIHFKISIPKEILQAIQALAQEEEACI